MPTTLTNGIQLPDKGSVDWYNSMQSNYNLIDTHLGDTDTHVTAEDKANWNSKQGSLSQAQLDAIAQVATNTDDIATLQSGKADASHTHSSSDITDIDDYATKDYVDNSISGLVDNAPAALDTLKELSTALNDDANFASTVTTALSAKANSADLATVATSGDYNDLDNLPTIPTKTSDLTNDSNFVDTSNSAVSSGITSAKVTDYDTHIADTDIHVTASDKTTWNAVTSKANDSDAVHKGGDETIGGIKTFDSNTFIYNSDTNATTPYLFLKNSKASKGSTSEIGAQLLKFIDKNNNLLSEIESTVTSNGACELRLSSNTLDSDNQNVKTGVTLISNTNGFKRFCPTSDNNVFLGDSALKWARVYSTQYYYGNDNVEFSTKFVTTDTAQTISESKTFANTIKIKKEIELSGSRLAYILPEFSAGYAGLSLCTYASNGAVKIGTWKVDDNDNTKHVLDDSLGYLNISTGAVNSVNIVYLTPRNASKAKLGDSVNKWHEINGVEPSSLSLPDLSNSIDISSYITDLTGSPNVYSSPANGYIVLRSTTANVLGIVENTTGMGTYSRGSNQVLAVNLPVVKNSSISIYAICSSLTQAKFIPCQGNI